MDRQDEWDREDLVRRLLAVEEAQKAIEAIEQEQSALRIRLRGMPRRLDEARWKLAEAIRLASRAAGPSGRK